MPAEPDKEILARIHPRGMASTLIRGGIAIGVYEAVKHRVVDKVRWFVDLDYADDLRANWSQDYKDAVLSLADEPTHATKDSPRHVPEFVVLQCSVRWLQEANAITESQSEAFWRFRRTRNQFAHEMLREAVEATVALTRSDYDGLLDFARAVELFWVRVEIDLCEEFDGVTIEDDQIGLPFHEVLCLMRDSVDAAEELMIEAASLVADGSWMPRVEDVIE